MKTALKYPGSKSALAEQIIQQFPTHKVYLEPYFGSGAVFFKKPPSYMETINDLDGRIVNFFKVCRDYPDELAMAINLTPYARSEYESIKEDHAGENIKETDDPIENARRFAVRCNQSFGGTTSAPVGWRHSKVSTGPNCPQLWIKIPKTIIEIAKRLKYAQIENKDAVKLIEDYKTSEVLIYADPPYLSDTRGKRLYFYEMGSVNEHERLLLSLLSHPGSVILSGYDSDLYNDMLPDWSKIKMQAFDAIGKKRTEVLWLNFEPASQIGMAELMGKDKGR